jgi:uncharacterized protein YuzE
MQEAELFEIAGKRTTLPEKFISLNYRKETDLLAIRFSNRKRIYSKADMKEGIIYDYDSKDNLVGVEIFDFCDASIGENKIESADQILVEEKIKKVEKIAQGKNVNKNRARKITRRCCKECGQPKHYICLKHNSQFKPATFRILPKRFKYYMRKFYFNVARKIGIVE